MLHISILFTLFCIISIVNALPIQDTKLLQVAFYREKQKAFDFSDENLKNWYQSEEYGVYSSMVDYYENLVDSTLSSESEELLIDLIHLPKNSMNQILDLQANLIGIDTLSDKQLIRMPSIIGKHIQQMNNKLFKSIENAVTIHWSTFWNPKILEEKQDEITLSFLSTFNGIIAKRLMDEMDAYDLLEQIKDDVLSIKSDAMPSVYQASWMQTFKHEIYSIWNRFTKMSNQQQEMTSDMEIDFLRQHLANIRTNLLMELHTQFMDFFSRLQADILDQLSIYYDQ